MSRTEQAIHAMFWLAIVAGYLYLGLADPSAYGITPK